MGIFDVLVSHMVLSSMNPSSMQAGRIMQYSADFTRNLPESFDSILKWPYCRTLDEIRDQGRCGACWATATAGVMTDRVCIQSNGAENFHFSAEDILSCTPGTLGCGGGLPMPVWTHWEKTGYVSGGNYKSKAGCKPYSIPKCKQHMKKCSKNLLPTPKCLQNCRPDYARNYTADLRKGQPYYVLKREVDIMADIFLKGPVAAIMYVCDDMEDYKGGIYQASSSGKCRGGHVVKIVGWGVENGQKYWRVANSWGKDFGENGFFRIRRGTNECQIEFMASAADPILRSGNW